MKDNSIPMHSPVIIDQAFWAMHDMPCAVCHTRKAVLDMSNEMVFQPCWNCIMDGWHLQRPTKARAGRHRKNIRARIFGK